jgi:NAD(P)-dependent dehydrogenase (short-subunit alcohol dehydrogenase family)
MFTDLKNKNIILTGGLGFLGKQIVNAFNDEGSNIIILDNKKKVSSEKFEHFNCNISNEKSLSLISKKILRKYKKIDILINNAASNHDIKSKIKSFERFDLKIWEKDILVGLTGSFVQKYLGLSCPNKLVVEI